MSEGEEKEGGREGILVYRCICNAFMCIGKDQELSLATHWNKVQSFRHHLFQLDSLMGCTGNTDPRNAGSYLIGRLHHTCTAHRHMYHVHCTLDPVALPCRGHVRVTRESCDTPTTWYTVPAALNCSSASGTSTLWPSSMEEV